MATVLPAAAILAIFAVLTELLEEKPWVLLMDGPIEDPLLCVCCMAESPFEKGSPMTYSLLIFRPTLVGSEGR